MREFLKYYKNENEDRVNYSLIKRENLMEEAIQFIVNASKSLEICENIQFIGYSINNDETSINPESYVTQRGGDKNTKYIYTNDNRNLELTLKFKISAFEKKSGKVESEYIEKKILIPKIDENDYFTLKGKKRYLIYQLLESSTYNTSNGITVKSYLPIDLIREFDDLTDTTGEKYTCPIYVVKMFNKLRDILLFYCAHMGFYNTLRYFSCDSIIDVYESIDPEIVEPNDEKYLYFKMNNNIYIRVVKDFFLKHKYVKSVVAMIKQLFNNRTTILQIDSKDYYLELIGKGQSVSKLTDAKAKGLTTLQFFQRMLDINTQLILKLDPVNKKDIFALIRCLIQNFDEFRSKDNMDMAYKRLRSPEFIGVQYTTLISKRFIRVISQKTITLKALEQIFAFNGNSLISSIIKSGLLVYDDKMNDLDAILKLKWTMKGQNSLGNKNSKKLISKYRVLDPSKLGIQDIIAIGNSDCCGHLHIVRYDVKISRIAGTSLELIHYNEIGNDKRDSLKNYKIG